VDVPVPVCVPVPDTEVVPVCRPVLETDAVFVAVRLPVTVAEGVDMLLEEAVRVFVVVAVPV
jgi:hypothetical protein